MQDSTSLLCRSKSFDTAYVLSTLQEGCIQQLVSQLFLGRQNGNGNKNCRQYLHMNLRDTSSINAFKEPRSKSKARHRLTIIQKETPKKVCNNSVFLKPKQGCFGI